MQRAPQAEQETIIRGIFEGDFATKAGGGDDSTFLWNHGLGPTASLAATLQHAKETLDKCKGTEMKTICGDLERALQRYLDLNALFSQPLTRAEYPACFNDAAELLRHGRATCITAVMLGHMRKHHAKQFPAKGLVRTQMEHALKPMFETPCEPQIQRTVWAAAGQGKLLR